MLRQLTFRHWIEAEADVCRFLPSYVFTIKEHPRPDANAQWWAGNGQTRFRWLDMHPELVKALSWWHEARPCKADNVFMQTHCDGVLGEPFRQKRHFMHALCKRAGVKPFGFHALRHKSAAITFVTSGLNAAQVLMGHYRATTTDRYVRSAGLYTDHSAIMAALGGSGIGQAVGSLLKNKFPHEHVAHGEIVTSEFVTQ